MAVADAEAVLNRAKKRLDDYYSKPPAGTLVSFDDNVSGGTTVYAIRLDRYHGGRNHKDDAGLGWMTIFTDGSGKFYADTDGGLSDFWLENPKEVYRP